MKCFLVTGWINFKITDSDVLKKSEQKFHPIAIASNDPDDRIIGKLFEVSSEELHQADAYEVSDYQRIKTTFAIRQARLGLCKGRA